MPMFFSLFVEICFYVNVISLLLCKLFDQKTTTPCGSERRQKQLVDLCKLALVDLHFLW